MRTFPRSSAASAALLIAVTTMASAQTHPSFAGTWTLDPAKTVVDGQGGTPSSATRTVVVRGDTLIVDNEAVSAEQGTQKTHLVWGTDGKSWKNTVDFQGSPLEVTSVLTWDGATLVITTALSVMGASVTQLDRWTLAADGKTMETKRSISADGADIGTVTMTYVKKN